MGRHSITSEVSEKEILRQSLLEYLRIIDECMNKKHEPQDYKDLSRHPSYSKFEMPGHIKAHHRYLHSRRLYEEQFQREIALLLENQTLAYEAARFSRHMCITTLWPPLHSRREIANTQRKFFQLTKKQKKRYEYLMATNIQ